MRLEARKQCLYDLKTLGYQVGAGFMVGSPGQTAETLADDLVFLKELDPQMVGIGPFIPHHDTMFAQEPSGSVPLTLFLLSVIRIMLPHVLLPATTALGTADPLGREKGLQHGANVVMPNLSPVKTGNSMICMITRSAPERKQRNAADAWDAEWRVSDLLWSVTVEISGHSMFRGALKIK